MVDTVDRKILLAFIQGLISDDKEREKAVEYIQNMPSGQRSETMIKQDLITQNETLMWYNM